MMTTFAEELEREASERNEFIEYAVIGEMGWDGYNEKGKTPPTEIKNTLMKWEDLRKFLDYEYDDGYGAPDCHAVYAWTKSWIIFVSQYDGSTTVYSIPRNPIAIRPFMPGG